MDVPKKWSSKKCWGYGPARWSWPSAAAAAVQALFGLRLRLGDISSTKEIRKGEVQKQIQGLISIHSNSIKKLGWTSTARDLTSEDGDINRKDRNLANEHGGICSSCSHQPFYEVILVAPVGPTRLVTFLGGTCWKMPCVTVTTASSCRRGTGDPVQGGEMVGLQIYTWKK